MVEIGQLKEIGLSDSEAKIYIALLKLREATVAEISQSSGLHRTNIYDSLEKLKEKGLVSYLLKEKKQFFRATDPENILNYLKEQEDKISKILPELREMQSQISEKVTVEVLKGKMGMKSALKDILLKKQEVFGYSISGQLRKFLPEFSEYYFREQAKYKIKHKFIYTSGVAKPNVPYYEARYLSKEFASATLSLCFGDTVLNLIWEPEMIAIRIKSKLLAENFRKHFQMLWNMAKK